MNMINFNDFKQQAVGFRTGPSAQAPKKTTKFAIFRFNDPHGNTDLLTGMFEAGKIFRAKHQLDKDTICITASGGDNVSGGDVGKNNFVFNLMDNIAQVEVSAVGNHELDATSKGFYEAAKDTRINFIATNVELDSDNPLRNMIKKSLIKEKNGVKYGFVGAMPIDFEKCTKKASQEGIEVEDFDDTVESLQEEIDELKAQGVNKIFLLSHVGYETDKKLAQALDGVDVIIGGHTHSVVDGAKSGENLVRSKSGEPVIITQTGENGKYYGLLDVEFDENGILTSVTNSLQGSTMTAKSPVVEYVKKQKLGESPVVGKITKIDKMPKNRRIESCAWTDWLADSMRAEMKTDIAIVNAANTRKVPQEGTLTQRDVSESSPMKNRLLKTTITQKQLVQATKDASRQSMSDFEGSPGLLHFSGVKYKIDKSGNLLEMSVLDKTGKYQKIDINNPSDTIVYSATYDDFVAKAGGEYPALAPKEGVKTEKFEFDKDETMIKYLSRPEVKDNIQITDDKRLEIV